MGLGPVLCDKCALLREENARLQTKVADLTALMNESAAKLAKVVKLCEHDTHEEYGSTFCDEDCRGCKAEAAAKEDPGD